MNPGPSVDEPDDDFLLAIALQKKLLIEYQQDNDKDIDKGIPIYALELFEAEMNNIGNRLDDYSLALKYQSELQQIQEQEEADHEYALSLDQGRAMVPRVVNAVRCPIMNQLTQDTEPIKSHDHTKARG
jgi:hypothetical protein